MKIVGYDRHQKQKYLSKKINRHFRHNKLLLQRRLRAFFWKVHLWTHRVAKGNGGSWSWILKLTRATDPKVNYPEFCSLAKAWSISPAQALQKRIRNRDDVHWSSNMSNLSPIEPCCFTFLAWFCGFKDTPDWLFQFFFHNLHFFPYSAWYPNWACDLPEQNSCICVLCSIKRYFPVEKPSIDWFRRFSYFKKIMIDTERIV